MAAKRAADSTLYHLAPRGFWKKFREVVAVNPEISSGLPLPELNRRPQPASRPERYATPATKASDPAQNPYWKRDVRRQYPQLSVITQSSMAQVLLNAPELRAVSAPTEGTSTEAAKTADPAVAVATPAPTAPHHEIRTPLGYARELCQPAKVLQRIVSTCKRARCVRALAMGTKTFGDF